MKPILGVLVAAAFLAVPAQATDIFPYPYHKLELDNGFKAYLIHAGAPGQIAYVTVVRTGSREEWEPGRTGYAHFFEHMMFRGTKKYPHYDTVLTSIGADNNAFTSNDMTVFYSVASSDSLEKLKVHDTAFDRHTYKHLTIGLEADVRAMPEGYEYSRKFFQHYYRPENCVLLLVGDFDENRAEQLVRKYYASWKPGYVAPTIQPEPEQTAPREASVEFPGSSLPMLSINYKGPAWSATDREAVASQLLGELAFGENSAIYRKLVLNEQKVQNMSADFDLQRDPGLLAVTSMVPNPKDLQYVQDEVEKTAALYREQLCDEQKLEDTKKALRYGFLMNLETAQGIAFSLVGIVVPTGGIEAVNDYYATLESVTPQDVKAAADRYLVP
ncbi:MAG: pitrilysin family protein, partial [Acidobacteriota bacterium]